MGVFLAYTLKSAVCLALFYLFYKLLLSRETYHRFNRLALLGVLVASWLLPLVEVTLEDGGEVGQTLVEMQSWLMVPEAVGEAAVLPQESVVSEATEVSWAAVVLLVYVAGIAFFLLRYGWSLLRLFRLLRSGRREPVSRYVAGVQQRVVLVVHERSVAPFSWGRYIVISRKDLEEDGREILIHELAHIHCHHTWDILLADFSIFLQWFNPAAWLLKQELQNVHEYEADETVLRMGVDAKSYQLLLIKKAVGTRLYTMANSFNHSKLKKRITMMTKKQSNAWARLKYLYVLPVAAVAVTAFARPEVSEQADRLSAAEVSDFAAMFETKTAQNAESQAKDSMHYAVVTLQGKPNIANLQGKPTTVKMQTIGRPDTARNVDSLSLSSMVKVVDGKVTTDVSGLSPDRIASVFVIKTDTVKALYGAQDKEGVMMINTVKDGEQKVTGKVTDGNGNPMFNMVMVVDGKVTTDISGIPATRIASFVVNKTDSAKAAYGAQDKDGVVMITTIKDDEQKVTGKVTDGNGEPIVGATVQVKGSKKGTVTGADGTFHLVAPEGSSLTISYVGMGTATVKAQPQIEVTLPADKSGTRRQRVQVTQTIDMSQAIESQQQVIDNQRQAIEEIKQTVKQLEGELSEFDFSSPMTSDEKKRYKAMIAQAKGLAGQIRGMEEQAQELLKQRDELIRQAEEVEKQAKEMERDARQAERATKRLER